MEQVYIHKFGPLVKTEHGGAVGYLRTVLGWPAEEGAGAAGEGTEGNGAAERAPYWTRTDEVVVRKNDWAYSIPHDAE